MPTYQYACTECGEQVEAVQKFTDDPLTVCTNCGARLRKVYSPVGIVFKGSGFYRTDSRSPANGSKVNGSSSSDSSAATEKSSGADAKSPGPDSGSSSSTDSKPAKKADTGKSSAAGTKVA